MELIIRDSSIPGDFITKFHCFSTFSNFSVGELLLALVSGIDSL